METLRFVRGGVLMWALCGCGMVKTFDPSQDQNVRGRNPEIGKLTDQRMFLDCKDVSQYIQSTKTLHRPVSSCSDAPSSSFSANTNGQTNLQELGVDEADVVKVTDQQIFVRRTHDIVVVDRTNQTQIGTITFDQDIHDMYLHADRLIVNLSSYFHQEVTTKIFLTKTNALPELTRTVTAKGALTDSRMIGDYLVLAVTTNLDDIASTNDIPEPNALNVKCQRTMTSPVVDYGNVTATALHAVNVMGQGDAESIALSFVGRYLYATERSLFLSSSRYTYDAGDKEQTFITQVDFDKTLGAFKVGGTGHVDGRVKDNWAFKAPSDVAKKDLLFVTTSTGTLWDETHPANNHLFTLKNTGTSLDTVAELKDFGLGEDVRAVRYVDDMAYVVTFKKTDPLYAIDLSDAYHPTLMSELVVPGFSTQLHPVGDGKHLIGIGYHADDQGSFAWFQGLQVSLFDVANPAKLVRLSNAVIGARGSFSEAQWDHHGFFYDADTGLFAIPYAEFGNADHAGTGTSDFKSSGALFYRMDATGFHEEARVSHEDLMPKLCSAALRSYQNSWWQSQIAGKDIRRIFTLDGQLYTVSSFGMKLFQGQDLSAIKKVVSFADSESFCANPIYSRGL